MLVLFGAGIWVVISLGSALRAQPDIAGDWLLTAESESGLSDQRFPARVEQSGRFVRFWIGDRLPMDLQIPKIKTDDDDAARPSRIQMTAPDVAVTFERRSEPELYSLTIETPRGAERFSARMVSRIYPRKSAAARAAAIEKNTAKSTAKPATSRPSSTHAP